MNAKEFQKAKHEFQNSIGADAVVSASVNDMYWEHRGPLQCTIYPFGLCRDSAVAVDASDFAELLEKAKAKWADHQVEHVKQVTRKMALAIIRLTAENGQCTDAALRQEFPTKEVRLYSAAACADANDIAGKGPFSIVTFGGANGAPDKIEVPEGATVN